MEIKLMKQIVGTENYFATKEGEIYSVKETKTKGTIKKIISQRVNKENGFKEVFITINKERKCFKTHSLIYKTFKGEYEGNLIFLDGDKTNVSLKNLVSIEELKECYIKHNS